jgi:hypothetical protein
VASHCEEDEALPSAEPARRRLGEHLTRFVGEEAEARPDELAIEVGRQPGTDGGQSWSDSSQPTDAEASLAHSGRSEVRPQMVRLPEHVLSARLTSCAIVRPGVSVILFEHCRPG